MMNIVFFWLPVVLAHTTADPVTVPAKADIPAAQAWADAVTERADQGWHLRDMATSQDSDGIQISLTLASSDHAELFSLSYQVGESSFAEFGQRAVALPTEARDYLAERTLFEELSTGAPTAISLDCVDFLLDFGTTSVPLAEDDFELPLWSTGRRSGAALSSWLADSLDGGQLIDIRDERVDDGAKVVAQVVFVVQSESGVEEMRVDLSANGAPRHLHLIHSPRSGHWESHPAGEELRSIAAKSAIRKLHFGDDDMGAAPKLQIKAGQGAAMALDLAEFSPGEEACGC
jgi:hypothetical protein